MTSFIIGTIGITIGTVGSGRAIVDGVTPCCSAECRVGLKMAAESLLLLLLIVSLFGANLGG